jgi:hypothetical protein
LPHDRSVLGNTTITVQPAVGYLPHGRLGHNCFIRSHIVTHDGRLTVPFQHYLRWPKDDASSYGEDRRLCDPRNGVLISGDNGKTWTEYGDIRLTDNPRYFGWAEPSIVELADGTIKMLIRADGLGGALYAAESKDGGTTWTRLDARVDPESRRHADLREEKTACPGSCPWLRLSARTLPQVA